MAPTTCPRCRRCLRRTEKNLPRARPACSWWSDRRAPASLPIRFTSRRNVLIGFLPCNVAQPEHHACLAVYMAGQHSGWPVAPPADSVLLLLPSQVSQERG